LESIPHGIASPRRRAALNRCSGVPGPMRPLLIEDSARITQTFNDDFNRRFGRSGRRHPAGRWFFQM